MWLARPLAVATRGSTLSDGERAFVAWVCRRGIVAASVAGLFRVLLEEAGMGGGAEVEALVFVTVTTTVIWQGLTAGRVARVFGADLPATLGAAIVGADVLGRPLGRTLEANGRQLVLIDASPWACRAARREGLAAYEGESLSVGGPKPHPRAECPGRPARSGELSRRDGPRARAARRHRGGRRDPVPR